MSPETTGIAGIVFLLLILFFTGIPVAFGMALAGFAGFALLVSPEAAFSMMSTSLWATTSKYGLAVIPMFVLMGQIVFYSGVNEVLYDVAYKWTGHIRGGLAMSTVMACAAFATICGSKTATAATMSTVALPQMKRFNYHPQLSTASVACGSTLGVVIPPSVVLILIGLSTEQSIIKLFYGGIGAGILLTFLLMVAIYVNCLIHPQWGPAGASFTLKEKIKALPETFEMALLFLLIILGLYFGLFTPGEAGAAGAFIAAIIGFATRKLTIKNFLLALKDTLSVTAMIFAILWGASVFGKFLTVSRLPFELASWAVSTSLTPVLIMTLIFIVYIIGGMIIDSLAFLMITLPIFYTVALSLGYDPLWFGVIITVITTFGAVSPPVGAAAYVVAAMDKETPLNDIFKGILKLTPAYIVCIILLLMFPFIITALPSLISR